MEISECLCVFIQGTIRSWILRESRDPEDHSVQPPPSVGIHFPVFLVGGPSASSWALLQWAQLSLHSCHLHLAPICPFWLSTSYQNPIFKTHINRPDSAFTQQPLDLLKTRCMAPTIFSYLATRFSFPFLRWSDFCTSHHTTFFLSSQSHLPTQFNIRHWEQNAIYT